MLYVNTYSKETTKAVMSNLLLNMCVQFLNQKGHTHRHTHRHTQTQTHTDTNTHRHTHTLVTLNELGQIINQRSCCCFNSEVGCIQHLDNEP